MSTIARRGVSGQGTSLPYLEQIQSSFGPAHDLSPVRAHMDDGAAHAAESLGAEAYATGNHVAFRGTPDLHTAAHEAAHVVQQRSGPPLGDAGDTDERKADEVADRVVQGAPAGSLLDHRSPPHHGDGNAVTNVAVQCKKQRGLALDAKHHPGVKNWIRQRGQREIADIVTKLDLATDKPQLVREVTLDKATHRWELSLTWNPSAGSSTAMTATDPAKPNVHVFDVDVGYRHGSRDLAEIPKESPFWGLKDTGVDRGIFLTAEALHHELIHVLIRIGQDLERLSPGFAGHSAAFERYRDVLGVVQGPAYTDLQTKISAGLTTLGMLASRDLQLPVPASTLAGWSAGGYEFFVQEKVAFRESGKRFRSSPSNTTVAQAYVANYVKKLIPDPTLADVLYRRLQASDRYAASERGLVADVVSLLHGIDVDPAITGDFAPGLMIPRSTGALPAPVLMDGSPRPR